MKMKIKNELQTRASFKPDSFDAEKRTVDIVWSTGSRVKRWSWDGPYNEELSMSPSHIRMDRMKNGANVLDNHSSYGLRNIIGVVEKAWIKDGEGHATIRLSGRDDVKGIAQDIQDGVIRNISVGYKVHKYKKIKDESRAEDDEDETPLYRAVDWEPMEVSFVCIPADVKAQSRSESNTNDDSYECEIIQNNGEESMKTKGKATAKKPVVRSEKSKVAKKKDIEAEVITRTESDPKEDDEELEEDESEEVEEDNEEVEEDENEGGPVDSSDEPEVSEKEVRAAEIKRGKSIRTSVRLAGLDEEFADKLIENPNMTLEKARSEIFKKLEKSQPETRNNKIEVRDMDNKQLRREATARAILHRADPSVHKLKDGDSEFVQPSLLMTARHYLRQELGIKDAYTMADSEVAKRALHHTSDFPLLLADVSNKSLRAGYDSVPSTYELFTRVNPNVTNFKDINSYEVSKGGMLRKVNEHGEYERGSIVESGEKYRVEKFGLIIGKTWELMLNDDLGAFTNIANGLGQRAREMENQSFWDLIKLNPLMSDGFAFFSAEHNNLGSAAALGETPLSLMRSRMRLMKDLDGQLISVASKYLVLPTTLETAGDKLLASVTPANASDVNVFSGKLTPVVEAQLDANSATAYYTFADKARLAAAEVARLDNKGPEIFTREGFDIDGMEVKIRYVYGMKLINYRAAQKNPGA